MFLNMPIGRGLIELICSNIDRTSLNIKAPANAIGVFNITSPVNPVTFDVIGENNSCKVSNPIR